MTDSDDTASQDQETPPAASSDSATKQSAILSLYRRLTAPKPPQPDKPPGGAKRRREGALSALSGLLSFVLVLLFAGMAGLMSAHHLLNEPGPLRAEKIVFLPPGSDTPEMLAQLESEGVIENSFVLNLALLLEGKRGGLRAGEYSFKPGITAREAIDELMNGRQLLHAVTIPEGLTSEQIAQRLRESDVLAGEVREAPKEGTLLPETYKVTRGYPRSKLVVKMQDDQRKLVDQIWARRSQDLPLRTPYELVTLASIVEKETGKAEERPRVASVFINRLRKGMRLQSDPTIVYGLVGGRASLGRGILRSEIEKYTPYNTYIIDGLPPGPIANPGRAALEATANPAPSNDLFFVADGTGGHVFSPSLDQHNRNVQHWRQIERENKEKAAAPDVDHAPPGAVEPPAAPPVAAPDRRGDAGPVIGRLVVVAATGADFPRSSAMSAETGAALRLGRFGSRPALLAMEALDNPAGEVGALRPALFHAMLTATQAPAFDVAALVAARPEEGPDPADTAAESPEGKALPDSGGVATYPASPRLAAELKARAARFGLSSRFEALPEGVIDRQASPPGVDPALDPEGARSESPPPAAGRRRIVDASEGTALDPLRDKNWDLSSAKTVPSAFPQR